MSYDTLDNTPTMDGGDQGGKLLADRYRVVRKLGEGGMGMVYLAEDTELGTQVAIKFIPPMLAGNKRAVKNLKREAATAMQLSHANIVRLHDLHTDGHQKFLVMEYIEGQTLEDLLAEQEDEKLPLERVLPIAEQLAAALDYAHCEKVLHRDLKPSNIMIASNGKAKLLDFGIAREIKDSFTRVTGQETSGTLPYMSPEQLRGQPPSSSMDIYSFAAVFYECLCGHAPFYTGDLRHQILEESPQPLNNPQASGLMCALAKDPNQRPATAGELVAMLRASEEGEAEGRREKAEGVGYEGKTPAGRAVPDDLIQVAAEYASLSGLAPGSREAQERQRQAVDRLNLPLEVKTRKTGIVLRLIPAGRFTMGSPSGETDREDDEREHPVTLTKPFYCGKYEVTQGQWQAVMGSNPSKFINAGQDAPVEQVSWDDCQTFLKTLCQKEGVPEGTYRLLTEAEWEYACRAGTQTVFCFGNALDSTKANFDGNYPYGNGRAGQYRKATVGVGTFSPNGWGIYDMHGNVWEWCQDWYGDYPSGIATDPLGARSGDSRVFRGGSWRHLARGCRSAFRLWYSPDYRRSSLGLRLARTAPSYP